MLEAQKETFNMPMLITDWILSNRELCLVAILPACVATTTGVWPSLTSAQYRNSAGDTSSGNRSWSQGSQWDSMNLLVLSKDSNYCQLSTDC